MYDSIDEYDELVSLFLRLEELGYTNVFGSDETSVDFWTMMCAADPTSGWCSIPDNIGDIVDVFETFHRYPLPLTAFLYFS